MSVRVFIRDGCTGMGSCTSLAPAVFRLGKDGRPEVLVDEADVHEAQLRRAARACPFVGVEIDGVPLEERFTDTPVAGVRRLTADVIELRVRCRSLPYTPGQYVFLRMRDARGEFFRTYSVVAAAGGEVVLCIKLLANGRAGAVLAGIAPGAVLGLSRAAGLFKLLTSDRPKLFVTGGTGVAPVLPMARAAAAAPKVVVFGARSAEDLFYLDELRALPNTRLVQVVQQPAPGWRGQTGLVTDILAASDLEEFHEIYTCGSPGMVEAVRRTATAQGFPAERIFADSFAAAPTAQAPAAAKPAAVAGVMAPIALVADAAVSPGPVPARPAPQAPAATRPEPGPGAGAVLLMLLRQVHYLASVLVCALIMFFAATGFIANHTDWLLAQGGPATASATITLPPAPAAGGEEQPLALVRGLFPAASAVEGLGGDGHAAFLVRGPGALLQRCELDLERRAAVVTALLPLAAPLAAGDDQTLIAALIARHGGELNDKSIESAAGALAFEAESVWQTDAYQVDRAHAVYALNRSAEPLAKVISDLHRGKHAGVAQKLIMDVAALALLVVAITGTVMGLQVVRRRRSALVLIAVSTVALITMLLHR